MLYYIECNKEYGTGFQISKNYVLTCAHVLKKPDDNQEIFLWKEGSIYDAEEPTATAEIVKVSENLDLALLSLNSLLDSDLCYFEKCKMPSDGDELTFNGFSEGKDFFFINNNKVKTTKFDAEARGQSQKLGFYYASGNKTYNGLSGSPVFLKKTKDFIGVFQGKTKNKSNWAIISFESVKEFCKGYHNFEDNEINNSANVSKALKEKIKQNIETILEKEEAKNIKTCLLKEIKEKDKSFKAGEEKEYSQSIASFFIIMKILKDNLDLIDTCFIPAIRLCMENMSKEKYSIDDIKSTWNVAREMFGWLLLLYMKHGNWMSNRTIAKNIELNLPALDVLFIPIAVGVATKTPVLYDVEIPGQMPKGEHVFLPENGWSDTDSVNSMMQNLWKAILPQMPMAEFDIGFLDSMIARRNNEKRYYYLVFNKVDTVFQKKQLKNINKIFMGDEENVLSISNNQLKAKLLEFFESKPTFGEKNA